MFRWLLLALFLYLLYKYASYVLELFSSGKNKLNKDDDKKSKVNVRYNPGENQKKHEDGEYIDFEEVKD